MRVCFVDCDPYITWYEHTVLAQVSITLWSTIVEMEKFPTLRSCVFSENTFLFILANTLGDQFRVFFILEEVHMFDNICVIEEAHTKHFPLREVDINCRGGLL